MGRQKKNPAGIIYPKGRVHHIVSNVLDRDGNVILTKDKILEALKRHPCESWAVVLHDGDVIDGEAVASREAQRNKMLVDKYSNLAIQAGYTAMPDGKGLGGYPDDMRLRLDAQAYVDKYAPDVQVGDLKAPHYHIVIVFKTTRATNEVAGWFGLDPHFDDLKVGRGAAESAYKYLVHANDPAKHQYSAAEVTASFDYVAELDSMLQKQVAHEKYHIDPDDINDVLLDVAEKGLSLLEAKQRISTPVYIRNFRLFEKARREYINHVAPMPAIRQVYYVEARGNADGSGKGGMGKTIATHALAKQFAREFGADISQDYDSPYMQQYISDAGDPRVGVQQYDGQPILVFNDYYASDLLKTFGSSKAVKEVLDMFPTKQTTNVKFGDTIILAKYIIINGIEPFAEFKRKLSSTTRGDRKASEQFDRRFWGQIVIVDESKMDVLFNRGIFNDTREYNQYIEYRNIRVNFREIAQRFSGRALAEVETSVMRPVISQIEAYEEEHAGGKIEDPNDIPDYFRTFGQIIDMEGDDAT